MYALTLLPARHSAEGAEFARDCAAPALQLAQVCAAPPRTQMASRPPGCHPGVTFQFYRLIADVSTTPPQPTTVRSEPAPSPHGMPCWDQNCATSHQRYTSTTPFRSTSENMELWIDFIHERLILKHTLQKQEFVNMLYR